MTNAPKSIKPIPPAREISMLMVTMAAINPAVRLGRRTLGWNSCLNSLKFMNGPFRICWVELTVL
ncbi:MAG TPA: hypothetical protein PLA27_00730 [Anaerolineales bacterium]|nr:hypothetical protein [Anaerolineales bacterium]